MPQQTPAQARVVDPILTTHAQGYARPGNVAKKLFPVAFVGSYGGQVLEFGKEAFRRYNTKRAPGTQTKRMTFGHAGKPYAIVPGALEAIVPRELQNDAAQVPGIDLATDAVDVVLDVQELEHECECADLARNAANYDADHKIALVGADRWTGANGDPAKDIATALEAIRSSIGIRGNTVILSSKALAAAQANEKVLERLKYTSASQVTIEDLRRIFGVADVSEGGAVAASGANDDFGDVWGADVIVAYVAPSASGSNRRNAAEPSFGYTYAIEGMPNVEMPYNDRSARSWIYPVANDATPVLSGIVAGYLIQNAGAPAA